MKVVFDILKTSIKQPRYALQSVSLNRKQILGVILLINLLLSLTGLLAVLPVVQGIGDSVAGASEYVPEFRQSATGRLEIEEGSKPLYYQSEYFQLVIDDTVRRDAEDGSIPLSAAQQEQMSTDTYISLFLFENVAYVGALDNVTEVPLQIDVFRTPNNLKVLLNYYNNNIAQLMIPAFVTLFVGSLVMYVFEMALLTFFMGVFSAPSMMQLKFGARFKLLVIASVFPILLVELVGLFVAIPLGRYFWVTVLTVFNVQRMFMDQSRFLSKLFKSGEFSSREEFMRYLREEFGRKGESDELDEDSSDDDSDGSDDKDSDNKNS
ncbi:DUF1189 family protein [Aerococcaceae bacterium DSM 111176]|nr:DUF1189 family protein [Aerococcaceae bacterium DSM 111176]